MKVAVVTAYFDAITRGDLDGLEDIVTDDYVFVTPQGERSLTEQQARGFPDNLHPELEVVESEVRGDEVHVVVRRTMRWTETGDVASVDDGRGRLVLRDGRIARAEMLV